MTVNSGIRVLTPRVKNRAGLFLLVLADALILMGLFYLAATIRKDVIPRVLHNAPLFDPRLRTYYWIFAIWLLILIYNGAYSKRFTFWDEVKFLWKTTFFASAAVFTVLFVGKLAETFSRILLLTMSMLSFVLYPLLRTRLKQIFYRLGLMRRKLLIVGAGESAWMAHNALRNEPNLGYEVAGFVEDDPDAPVSIDGIRVHRFIGGIDRYIKNCGIHDILIAKTGLDNERLTGIINSIQHKADNILFIPDISGIAVLGTELRHFFNEQALIIEIKNNLARPLNRIVKMAFDYICGLLLFVILSLPMLAIALMIRVTSRGRALFKQERIGKDGRPFMCYKFRTMHLDAEERLKKILDADPEARAEWQKYWKLKDDPRVTGIGRFLRKTSLDELPQLINVLRREMSLVGPRPVTREEIERYYGNHAELCFSVLPGITGLWQVSGRSNTAYDYRIALDSWYVRNWNVWLDIVILFKTVRTVFMAEGAM